MKTKKLLPEALFSAAEALLKGELVAFATETVYGLGANALLKEAVQTIFEVKRRPKDNPLILHVASLEKAKELVGELPEGFERLAGEFWPGPLTLIAPASKELPSWAISKKQTVAIRVPSHPLALALLREVNVPIAAPSANLSGKPSTTRAEDVLEDFDGKIPFILDGGACLLGIESTVIGWVEAKPTLFRPGILSKEEIERVLGERVLLASPDLAEMSPGMRYRHYAPRAKVRLVLEKEGIKGAFVLSPFPEQKEYLLTEKTLYTLFRQADREGIDLIEVFCPEIVQKNLGLMNRLYRAAESEL